MLGRHAATGQRGNCHAARRGTMLLEAGDSKATAAPPTPPPARGPGPTAALSPPLPRGISACGDRIFPRGGCCHICIHLIGMYLPVYSFIWKLIFHCFLLHILHVFCRTFWEFWAFFLRWPDFGPNGANLMNLSRTGPKLPLNPYQSKSSLLIFVQRIANTGWQKDKAVLSQKRLTRADIKSDRYMGNTRINWQEPGK